MCERENPLCPTECASSGGGVQAGDSLGRCWVTGCVCVCVCVCLCVCLSISLCGRRGCVYICAAYNLFFLFQCILLQSIFCVIVSLSKFC